MPLKRSVTFLQQAISSFHTTGAVMPSGPFLAKAMVKQLPKTGTAPDDFRVLEVGPGTGALTEEIVKRLRGRGRLDLCEINAQFSRLLHRRIHKSDIFKNMRRKIHIHECDVRKLTGRPTFNAIVSGLPFNNFEACEVRAFLEHYRKMLKPLGTLSFFEYMGVRRVQTRLALAPAPRRKRLREVGKVVQEFVREHELRRDIVVINIPPARVFHLRFDRDSAKADA